MISRTLPAPGRPALGQRASKIAWSLFAGLVVLLFFSPILWMVMQAFKTETQAEQIPPVFIFKPTLAAFSALFDPASYDLGRYFQNSVVATIGSTLLVIVLGLPAAYALSIRPVKRTRDFLFFFISTRFMPFAASLLALYLIVSQVFHALDNILVLVIMYGSLNLPLGIWLLRSFLLELPPELFEAARVDGARFWHEIRHVVMPLITPGLAATALICVIFAWNEFFYALNFTTFGAQTTPVFVGAQITGARALELAKLSAGTLLCSLPVMIAGWIAQKQLIRGLTMGAVK